ncbi:MAG: hypothetical protein H0V79_12725 [Actinobacteria bacterium]|nr:hypothetical protein [Actinomycetota bacterium]
MLSRQWKTSVGQLTRLPGLDTRPTRSASPLCLGCRRTRFPSGHGFALAFEVGENGETEVEERQLSEEELVEDFKQTFDAREVTPE